MNALYLLIAIAFEVLATSALKQTEGFTRLAPSLACIAGYALALYFMSLPLRTIPVGVVYAIWSGAGIVLVTVVAWFAFDQRLDAPALLGIGLILAGVVVLNLFSKTISH